MSTDMNCSSCHNPHAKESDDIAVFSQRCMNCHQTSGDHFCKQKGFAASVLAGNCIDCHMPALPSGNITLLTNGETKPTPDFIRTHLISIYPEETKKVIERLRKK
ncbi:hypothetical protein [Chitinophaga sp.]|uniref:hypothetical protein n=1 Tax=Chitinophaga sp. TaxID=1869181 RepID=UPI002F92F2D4